MQAHTHLSSMLPEPFTVAAHSRTCSPAKLWPTVRIKKQPRQYLPAPCSKSLRSKLFQAKKIEAKFYAETQGRAVNPDSVT
jgi:hypothetical protein